MWDMAVLEPVSSSFVGGRADGCVQIWILCNQNRQRCMVPNGDVFTRALGSDRSCCMMWFLRTAEWGTATDVVHTKRCWHSTRFWHSAVLIAQSWLPGPGIVFAGPFHGCCMMVIIDYCYWDLVKTPPRWSVTGDTLHVLLARTIWCRGTTETLVPNVTRNVFCPLPMGVKSANMSLWSYPATLPSQDTPVWWHR